MRLTNLDALMFAICPCAVERIEKIAKVRGAYSLLDTVSDMKYARNVLHFNIALIAIAAIGVVSSSPADPQRKYIFLTIATLNSVSATLFAIKLFDATLLFQQKLNLRLAYNSLFKST